MMDLISSTEILQPWLVRIAAFRIFGEKTTIMMGATSGDHQHWNGRLLASSPIENEEQIVLEEPLVNKTHDACCNTKNKSPPAFVAASLPPISGTAIA